LGPAVVTLVGTLGGTTFGGVLALLAARRQTAVALRIAEQQAEAALKLEDQRARARNQELEENWNREELQRRRIAHAEFVAAAHRVVDSRVELVMGWVEPSVRVGLIERLEGYFRDLHKWY